MDRWILSELYQTVERVRDRLDDYDVFAAATALNEFAEALSNWYVQRSRDRFWRSWKNPDRSAPEDLDKRDAYWTLYECLTTLAQAIAPFVPFMADEMWRNLARRALGERVAESVHLCDFPEADAEVLDRDLAGEMDLVREIVSLGRSVRAAQKLKVRLPLARMILVLADPARTEFLRAHEDVLKEAVNVKQVEYARQTEQYATFSLKPNFKAIGAKHRELVPAIKKALAEADAAGLRRQLDESGSCTIQARGRPVVLGVEEVEVTMAAKEGFAAAGGRREVVILDTHLTPELLEEGFARELVNRVNAFRGDLNLKYEQRVRLALKGSPKLEALARKFEPYVSRETLAVELRTGETPGGWKSCEIEVEGERGAVALAEA